MTTYIAPMHDMQFVINELADLKGIVSISGYEEVTPELVEAVLGEAARLASEVLSPLNKIGDKQGARWTKDGVTAPDGFGAAYRQFVANGWNALSGDPELGGQGLPDVVAAAAVEMWNSANMAFALCPLLTAGAMEAIKAHGAGGVEGPVSSEARQRRVDRHHGPDRVAGRIRSVGGSDEGRAGGRPLPAVRPEDLHHLGRPRHGRQHGAPGAWPACPTRRKERGESRCSSCPSSW